MTRGLAGWCSGYGGHTFAATGEVEISGDTVVVGWGGYDWRGNERWARVGLFVDVWYRRIGPPSRGLRDLAGNAVSTPRYYSENSRGTPVINAVNLTSLPSLGHATVKGGQLTLTFDAPMDEDSVPAGSAFTVKVGGNTVSLASANPVAVAGATVTLTLASAVASGTTVTVSYAKPSGRPLQNVVCDYVASFTDESVTNTTPRAGSPTVTEVALSSSAGADRIYGLGDEIRVRLTFDKAVNVTGTPQLKIDFSTEGWGAQVADYVSGSGTTMLEFAYEVVAPDVSTEGIAVLENTLALNGGTIRSASTTQLHADLAHDGLGHDANHRVDSTVPSLRSAAVDESTLTLTFSEALDESSVPAGSAFAVKKTPRGSGEEEVSSSGSPAIDGATVTLTLASAVRGTDTDVKVSYTKPASGTDNRLRDAAGNEVASFTDRAVTDETPPPPPPPLPRPTNLPPVADAGPDLAVEPGAEVRLDGSGSADPDGDALIYAWAQRGGTAVTLAGADTATPSLEAPAAPGVLSFQLTVSDPDGLTSSDTVTVRVGAVAVHHIPLFVSAAHSERESFARVINHSGEAGEVRIVAIDDAGRRTGAVTLPVPARSAVHFNSRDLEAGNSERGLSGGVGEGEGEWRLELESALDLEVLSYVRTPGGVLASLHDVVPEEEEGHRVVFFNPASNRGRVSWLRLINPGEESAAVRITGVDSAGEAGESAVVLTLAPRASRMLSAQALESGEGKGLAGALGDGAGKWRLRVTADQPLRVMSLFASGPHLTNVSTAPERIGDGSGSSGK